MMRNADDALPCDTCDGNIAKTGIPPCDGCGEKMAKGDTPPCDTCDGTLKKPDIPPCDTSDKMIANAIIPGWSERQRRFLDAYRQDPVIAPAARMAKVHRSTVYRWLTDPAFVAAMNDECEAFYVQHRAKVDA